MADIFNMTDTWTSAGTTYTAVGMSVTNTASAAGSQLLDLKVGGTSKFNVDPNGAAQGSSFLLKGTTSGVITITGKAVAGTWQMTLPDTDGNANEFLKTDGAGILSWAVPTATVADGDKTDITVSGSGATWTIDTNVVTYAKMQDVTATNRFLGRITTGAGDPEELSGTQATTLLDVFTTALKGVVPASGGGTTNFLRADGTWNAPAGGSLTDGDKVDITVSGSGATWTIDAGVVTYAKMQATSATDVILGRSSAGGGVIQEIACTSFGRALIDDTSVANQRTTLGLATVASSGSASDLSTGTLPAARLPALTGDVTSTVNTAATTIANGAVTYAKIQNVSATDKLLGRSTAGAGVVEEITCTSFARTLLDDTTQAAMRTTLGLTPGTDVQAQDAELAAIAGLTSAADRVPYFTGSGTASLATFTTFGRSLVDDADAVAARQTLVGSINAQTGTSYTFVLTDAEKLCTFSNAAAIAVTIPLNVSVAFPVGTQIDVVQTGAGKVTLGGSATILSQASNKSLAAQYAGATLRKTAADTWLLVGNLIA